MLHFEGLSFPVEGMFPDETQRKLISLSSKGRADEKTGIEKTAYAGTIAIKEEEPDDFVFRTPGMIERAARALLVVIPLLSWISHLRRFAYKTDDFNQRLNAAFKSMGPRDRIHVVGRVTHGVVIKTALELLFSRLRPRRRPHRT
jgi:hypothetical protein